MKKVFFDTEFTGLHQNTTLISIGLVTEQGDSFYAELTDYDKELVAKDKWIQDNVIAKLTLSSDNRLESFTNGVITERLGRITQGNETNVRGDQQFVAYSLTKWLEDQANGEKVELYSDTLSYDWVLFCQLWGHAFNIPSCMYYIPFDISTMFKLLGIDPDINREAFAGLEDNSGKYNALHDAKVIMKCYQNLLATK